MLKTPRVVSDRHMYEELGYFCVRDNKHIFQILGLHPTLKTYGPFGIEMLSAFVFVYENVCESPPISIVCLFPIIYATLLLTPDPTPG